MTFIPVRRLRPARESFWEAVQRLWRRKQAEEAELRARVNDFKYDPLKIEGDEFFEWRRYTTVECDGDFHVYAHYRNHGENIIGRNIYAVIDGDWLCKPKACKWCDDLRARCVSRRLA